MVCPTEEKFSGDIFTTLREINEMVKAGKEVNSTVVQTLGLVIDKFRKESFIPVEYSEKLLSSVGKLIECDSMCKNFQHFASNNTFIESLCSIVTDFSSKVSAQSSFADLSTSFSSHFCYELSLYILLGLLDKTHLLRSFVQVVDWKIVQLLLQSTWKIIIYDSLYLTQEMALEVMGRLFHFYLQSKDIQPRELFLDLPSNVVAALQNSESILKLLRDMRPFLNIVNATNPNIFSFKVSTCIISTDWKPVNTKRTVQNYGWLDVCKENLCFNLIEEEKLIRIPYHIVKDLSYIESTNTLQVFMESCPRKLYDILRPEEYPPTGRCPVLIFDFGDDKQILRDVKTIASMRLLERETFDADAVCKRKTSVVSSRNQTHQDVSEAVNKLKTFSAVVSPKSSSTRQERKKGNEVKVVAAAVEVYTPSSISSPDMNVTNSDSSQEGLPANKREPDSLLFLASSKPFTSGLVTTMRPKRSKSLSIAGAVAAANAPPAKRKKIDPLQAALKTKAKNVSSRGMKRTPMVEMKGSIKEKVATHLQTPAKSGNATISIPFGTNGLSGGISKHSFCTPAHAVSKTPVAIKVYDDELHITECAGHQPLANKTTTRTQQNIKATTSPLYNDEKENKPYRNSNAKMAPSDNRKGKRKVLQTLHSTLLPDSKRKVTSSKINYDVCNTTVASVKSNTMSSIGCTTTARMRTPHNQTETVSAAIDKGTRVNVSPLMNKRKYGSADRVSIPKIACSSSAENIEAAYNSANMADQVNNKQNCNTDLVMGMTRQKQPNEKLKILSKTSTYLNHPLRITRSVDRYFSLHQQRLQQENNKNQISLSVARPLKETANADMPNKVDAHMSCPADMKKDDSCMNQQDSTEEADQQNIVVDEVEGSAVKIALVEEMGDKDGKIIAPSSTEACADVEYLPWRNPAANTTTFVGNSIYAQLTATKAHLGGTATNNIPHAVIDDPAAIHSSIYLTSLRLHQTEDDRNNEQILNTNETESTKFAKFAQDLTQATVADKWDVDEQSQEECKNNKYAASASIVGAVSKQGNCNSKKANNTYKHAWKRKKSEEDKDVQVEESDGGDMEEDKMDLSAHSGSSFEEDGVVTALLGEIVKMQKERANRKRSKLLSNIANSATSQIQSFLDQWKISGEHNCSELQRTVNIKLETICASADSLCERLGKDAEVWIKRDKDKLDQIRCIEQDIVSLRGEVNSTVNTYRTEESKLRTDVLALKKSTMDTAKKTLNMHKDVRDHSSKKNNAELLRALNNF